MTESRIGAAPRRAGAAGARTCGGWLAANADLGRLDAELLAAHVMAVGRARVVAFPEAGLTRRQAHRLDRLGGRLRDGEPLAYILGRKEFFGLSLQLADSVLVPRPETELLVELALERAPKNARVADLGTGSGCIAIALKRERPDLRVVATDVSFAALQVGSANAAEAGVAIEFVQADWLGGLRGPFHWLIANPPYVADDDPALAALRGEPRLALTGGADGLAAIERVIEQAPARLLDGGCLLLEHGSDQAGAVRARLARKGFENIETHKDLAGHERATLARISHQLSSRAHRLPQQEVGEICGLAQSGR